MYTSGWSALVCEDCQSLARVANERARYPRVSKTHREKQIDGRDDTLHILGTGYTVCGVDLEAKDMLLTWRTGTDNRELHSSGFQGGGAQCAWR